ncbi:MAG TPA: HlyD family efflux transporter periplasmic adaptor subunit, partial [Rhodobacteraceae bacterium]|nr:HlyD family efflux transporter periplasmic adaptor subunit [Paracoccaceae bacterium]
MSFLCSVPLLNALLTSCLAPLPMATGYVEGEYTLLAPIEIAQIEKVSVKRGQEISAGQELVLLERRDAEIAVAQARATLAQAQSKLADISQGRRPEEIAVIEASLRSARAQADEARRELERQADLVRRGAIPQSKYDLAQTQAEVSDAKVAELEANLEVAKLPARAGAIAAAKAAVDQAKAALENALWRLSKRTLSATTDGVVIDVIRNRGETAGPQAPVLLVLPDGAVKLRLYLAEERLAEVQTGSRLKVSCDGCDSGITA